MKKGPLRLCILLLSLLAFIDIAAQDHAVIDKLFKQWEDSTILQPGISVAIIKNQKVIYTNISGYANLEYQIPLDHKSVFDIASLAKQFTGFAIAKLITEKKLRLDERVIAYFPELRFLDKELRIKHLVYHTSGLRDIGGLFALAYKRENLTSKDALDLLKHQRDLNFPMGTEYDYSNSNYVLLALIVERVTGITFREWCAKNLFTPLKMEDTFANDNPYEIIKNRAIAYNSTLPKLSFQQNNGMALIGSSAVYSTIDDMMIWIQALKNESIFPKVFKLMKQKGKLDNGKEIEYGFGLGISSFKNETLIQHTGATPSGFRTAMAILPDQSLALVVLGNWGKINPISDFGIKIINHYLQEIETTSEELPKLKTEKPGFALSKDVANKYIGNYLFNGEVSVHIRLSAEKNLMIQLEGQSEDLLVPISETEFELPAAKSKLHFINDSTGNCKRVIVFMNGQKEGELSRIEIQEKASVMNNKYVGLYYSDELKIVFEIGISNDQLILINSKNGEIMLNNKTAKIFIPEQGIASKLVFECNATGEVTGFLLNRGSRVRNLKFVKINQNQ